jgi:hypothetical protein
MQNMDLLRPQHPVQNTPVSNKKAENTPVNNTKVENT